MYIPKYNQLTYGYNSHRVQGATFCNYIPNEKKDATSYETFQNCIKELEMPFCYCQSFLELQTTAGKSSIIVNKMLQDVLKTNSTYKRTSYGIHRRL